MDAQTIESVLDRIASGESQTDICRSIGVSAAALSRTLNATPEITERSARARSESAEAWLDRGLEAIESALRKDGPIDPSAARALAQECARRAAIRNPAYREKTDHNLSGSVGIALSIKKEDVNVL